MTCPPCFSQAGANHLVVGAAHQEWHLLMTSRELLLETEDVLAISGNQTTTSAKGVLKCWKKSLDEGIFIQAALGCPPESLTAGLRDRYLLGYFWWGGSRTITFSTARLWRQVGVFLEVPVGTFTTCRYVSSLRVIIQNVGISTNLQGARSSDRTSHGLLKAHSKVSTFCCFASLPASSVRCQMSYITTWVLCLRGHVVHVVALVAAVRRLSRQLLFADLLPAGMTRDDERSIWCLWQANPQTFYLWLYLFTFKTRSCWLL